MTTLIKSKQAIIQKYASTKSDTGSVEVQCALFTAQIDNLSEHLKIHKKDFSSKRGLLLLVGKRKRLLKYAKSNSAQRYEDLIKKLDIRK